MGISLDGQQYEKMVVWLLSMDMPQWQWQICMGKVTDHPVPWSPYELCRRDEGGVLFCQ